MSAGGAVRRVRDVLVQAAGVAIIVAGIAIFAVLGLGLAKVLGERFGVLGWVLFAGILASWSMWFVPFVVAGIGVRRAGSEKHRAAARARVEEQRRRFGVAGD